MESLIKRSSSSKKFLHEGRRALKWGKVPGSHNPNSCLDDPLALGPLASLQQGAPSPGFTLRLKSVKRLIFPLTPHNTVSSSKIEIFPKDWETMKIELT